MNNRRRPRAADPDSDVDDGDDDGGDNYVGDYGGDDEVEESDKPQQTHDDSESIDDRTDLPFLSNEEFKKLMENTRKRNKAFHKAKKFTRRERRRQNESKKRQRMEETAEETTEEDIVRRTREIEEDKKFDTSIFLNFSPEAPRNPSDPDASYEIPSPDIPPGARSSAADIAMGVYSSDNVPQRSVSSRLLSSDTVPSGVPSGGISRTPSTPHRTSAEEKQRNREIVYIGAVKNICLQLFDSYPNTGSIYVKIPFCSKILIIREMIHYSIMAKYAEDAGRFDYTDADIQRDINDYLGAMIDASNRYRSPGGSYESVYKYNTILHKLQLDAIVKNIPRQDSLLESHSLVLSRVLRDELVEEVEENDQYPFVSLPRIEMMYMFSVKYNNKKQAYKIKKENTYPRNYNSQGLFEDYKNYVLATSDNKELAVRYYIFEVSARTKEGKHNYLVHVDGSKNHIQVRLVGNPEPVTFNLQYIFNPDINTPDRMRAIMQYVYGCILYIPWKWEKQN